jgi:M6 family metalloprotease-like protein
MNRQRHHRTAAALGAVCASFVLLSLLAPAASQVAKMAGPPPGPIPRAIDPQRVQDQDAMTWADYRPIPGANWADPSIKPQRGFKLAVVGIDFPGQPFVITLPKGSDPFGNPQVDPIPRDKVPQFYADFWMKPNAYNHGQTINGYWMEQSRGRFGITEVEVFGPYQMPKPIWHYGLNEYGQNSHTPDGSKPEGRMEQDCDAVWAAAIGQDVRKSYDAVLRLYASYDETGVWQEFGEMKFNSKDDIPAAWGNPNPDKPRWIPTRYVEWTSWLAGSRQWGLSSMRQGENSGTITHELGHFAFSLPDLNNNPYVKPYRRVAAGTWDMMDRGCFNGPGGPHKRWVVPPTQGAFMPAGLMVRNRLENKFIDESDLLILGRAQLASSGLAVAEVTARAVAPRPGACAGIIVRFDGEKTGDLTPPDDPAVDPLSPGTPNYDFYTLEVVQRIGYDSFTPDNGVLIAKNKNSLRGRNGGPNAFNSYIWVIDAHPEDISAVDYVKPNGEKVMRTVADYRQLNDALFHAGIGSCSLCEWVDEPNRLHFYVIDRHLDREGILSYTLAVRSLDGSGPQERGIALGYPVLRDPSDDFLVKPSVGRKIKNSEIPVSFKLVNEGRSAGTNADAAFDADVYRLSVEVEGSGWTARLPNGLTAVKNNSSRIVTVLVSRDAKSAKTATVTLRATSESDPTKSATATAKLARK